MDASYLVPCDPVVKKDRGFGPVRGGRGAKGSIVFDWSLEVIFL